MNLYERAKNSNNYKQSESNKADSDLADLHAHVQEVITADKLAEYIAKNPSRARAEIRSAAKISFNKTRWNGYSDDDKKY